MTNDSDRLKERIDTLRSSFVAQLPRRLAEARKAFEALGDRSVSLERKAALAENLHRALHSIKGTGSSLGFRELGEKAFDCEAALGDLARNGDEASNGRLLERLGDSLRALVDHGATLQSRSPEPTEGEARPEPLPEGACVPGADDRAGLVYFCDDDQLQVKLIGEQLECFGYRTRTFCATEDLVAAAREERPDVVVMDIVFPEGERDGASTVASLRDRGIDVPSIFISGRSDFDARIRAIRAGGLAYYPKPVDAAELAATIDSIVHPKRPEPFKVLVVDDEPDVGRLHAAILEEAGMKVEVVDLPERVLDRVSALRPDLLLMDMHMPGCSGREVATLIRQIPEFLSLPILFLSAETDRGVQLSALSVGAEGFLTKPIEPDELVAQVSLRAERMRTLHSLMMRDSLTGLYNHTTTTQFLASTLDAASRSNQPLCFAMIDLDHFKTVNDTWGHPVGDQVLMTLSRVFSQRLRRSDIVGRYGGEEFALILPNTDTASGRQVVDSLRADFSRILFHVGRESFSCTFSCGIAAFRLGMTVETLRSEADRLLYAAKKDGRNRIASGEE